MQSHFRPRGLLFLIVLGFSLACGNSTAIAAPVENRELVLRTGEIRLDGKIRSIDLASNSFVLEASSFTLPNGKTAPLSPARPKTVVLGEGTILYERGDIKRHVAAAELKPGVFAIVIGRDLGTGKDLPTREIAVWDRVEQGVFVFGVPTVVPVPTPTATPRQELPLQQTIDGYTLRVTDMNWIKIQELSPTYPWPDPYVKVLEAKYEVQSTDPNVPPQSGEALKQYIRKVRLTGPDGQQLVTEGNGQRTVWHADPRWNKVTAEFEFQDPATPPEVAGPFEDILEFKDLPLPKQLDKPLLINRSATTKNGEKFLIENVITRVVEQGDGEVQGELVFSLAQQSTPGVVLSAWNVSTSAAVRVVKLTDAEGTDLTATIAEEGYVRPDDAFPERMTFRIRPLPSKPQSLTVQVEVKDTPQRLLEKWYRRFRLPLNLPATAPLPLDNTYNPLVLTIGKTVDVTVENLLVRKSDEWKSYAARLWIKDKKQNKERGQQSDWIFRQAKVRWLRDGHEVESVLTRPDPIRESTAVDIYWKADGIPAQPDEMGKRLSLFDSRESPTDFTFDLTLQEVRKSQHQFVFSGIPIPAAGQVLVPNLARTTPSGARLVLRKVGYFPDEASWLALDPAQRGFVRPQLGLLAVFALERASGNTSGDQATIVMHGSEIKDDSGRVINPKPSSKAWLWEGLSGEQPKNRNFGTFVLTSPAADAKSFSMQIQVDETLPTGRLETVILPNIPVPNQ